MQKALYVMLKFSRHKNQRREREKEVFNIIQEKLT